MGTLILPNLNQILEALALRGLTVSNLQAPLALRSWHARSSSAIRASRKSATSLMRRSWDECDARCHICVAILRLRPSADQHRVAELKYSADMRQAVRDLRWTDEFLARVTF